MRIVSPLAVAAALVAVWGAVVELFGLPRFILPGPWEVARAWWSRPDIVTEHAWVTLVEILAGLALGAGLGMASALAMAYVRWLGRFLMPVLVTSQAVPVFALAPVLVLWFGYGMAPKIVMATLIIYFPVTAAFLDGLRRTEPGWLDLARTMGAGRWATLVHVRIPAALPALGSGLRVATAVAPIGAVVGEWIGSEAGLGRLMIDANARTRIDVMFAALLTLVAMAVTLYYAVDWAMRRIAPWQPDRLEGT